MPNSSATGPDAHLALLAGILAATSAPDPGEALDELLREALRAGGADAGAVLEGDTARVRAVHGCLPGWPRSLLLAGGALGPGARAEEGPTLLSGPPAFTDGERDFFHVLHLPLPARGVSVGGLVLAYSREAPPEPGEVAGAGALAGVSALVVENDRLYEEARLARQARDHFLTALNHELRTPATALMLDAGILQSGIFGDLPEPASRMADQLETHINDLVRVVSNVLDLARLEAGVSGAREDLIQPRQTVLDLLRKAEPAAKRKGVEISVYLPRSLPAMQTDRERFSRILLHLVSNAVKYTERGMVEVRVESATRSVGGHRREPVLTVSVRNPGRGIPPEQLDRVFEPFAQVDEGSRTDSTRRGIGLGLSLARKMARSLGGEVTIESEPERGTVAQLILPYLQPR